MSSWYPAEHQWAAPMPAAGLAGFGAAVAAAAGGPTSLVGCGIGGEHAATASSRQIAIRTNKVFMSCRFIHEGNLYLRLNHALRPKADERD